MTLDLTIGTTTTHLTAASANGIWTVNSLLNDVGVVTAGVTITYDNQTTNTVPLPLFKVETLDDHSLVRIQPELMTNHSFRSVTAGVAITPVSKQFFTSGPGFLTTWRPSAVIRFSGDNTTVIQFGFGLSVFLNRSMLLNGGLLFGSTDQTQYWNWKSNLFFGFAIDPALLTEAKNGAK